MLLFEGRDAAGKGGTIKRFMEHLNPRYARTVALSRPSDREQRQWYFQRYVPVPADRRRDGALRPVLVQPRGRRTGDGFRLDADDYEQFMAQAPVFERMLVDSGISLTKLWFSVTQSEQRTRFIIRQVDPVRQWKLSPIDLESLDKWDDYTEAKEEMFLRTDTDWAPWTDGEEQRQEASPGQRDAGVPVAVRLRGQGRRQWSVQPDPAIVQRGIDAVGD